jgi:hypothetical protein
MKKAIEQAIKAIEEGESFDYLDTHVVPMLRRAAQTRLSKEQLDRYWAQSGNDHIKFGELIEKFFANEIFS